MRHTPHTRGVTIMLVLAFMGVFGIIIVTVSSYAMQQGKYGRALFAREQALHIAEAGLEYYRWFLAHYPNDLTDGTGQPGPYVHAVVEPEGGQIGSYSLVVASSTQCGVSQWIDITSTGRSDANQTFSRTLSARYMKPSVAEYNSILNANVWVGADRSVFGPYHTNGGVRMDGTNNAEVTSSVSSWTCDGSFGCSPTQSKPGVWGAGSGSALWSYPVATIDFAGIATNFSTLKTYAQNDGLLLEPTRVLLNGIQQGSTFSSVGGSDQRGFRVVFNSNGTVSVYRVTSTSGVTALHIDNLSQWTTDYHTITAEVLHGTYTLPSDCALVYAQAKTWIQGTVSGKLTLVAADTGAYNPDIILNNNISYNTTDGSTGLTAIAERSVLYPLVIPSTMTVRGIFVAQSGYYGRNLYPCWYSPNDIRTSLTVHGTVVSNQRVGTKWTYSGVSGCSSGSTSGFLTRTDTYDRLLAFAPPPFTPTVSADHVFVLWREQ